MIQKTIRPYEGDSYSIEEGSELILELDARTKSGRAGLNSLDELGAQVELLLNTGRYVGFYPDRASLEIARPSPKNGDRALVGDLATGAVTYNASNGQWRDDSVSYVAQSKSDEQKKQAQTNIGVDDFPDPFQAYQDALI